MSAATTTSCGSLEGGLEGRARPHVEMGRKELRRGGRQVVVRTTIGLTGFYAGPEVHIIDELALSDPLLARLPAAMQDP